MEIGLYMNTTLIKTMIMGIIVQMMNKNYKNFTIVLYR